MAQPAPSERELDVLKVLWQLGEAPVRDIHQALCEQSECAFTTIQTFLRIMAEKGLVKKRREGRTLYYAPNYTPERASSRFLHKVFDGAMSQMVLSMLKAENPSDEEMAELEKLIAAARREQTKDRPK